MSVYLLAGLFAGIAGMISIINLGNAIPGVGDTLLLIIIGGVVLGGTALQWVFGNPGDGGPAPEIAATSNLSWQIQAHILISMFAYGLLTAGAIVAVFALVQDRRLRAGKISSTNLLFAPLETTEKMLFGITAAGFSVLLLAVLSGFTFVEDLFAQHLVHKTVFSLLALLLFGILIAGRMFAGWRGKRAVYLYLWGFLFLCIAYFGARYVLEELLNRSWG